MLNTFRVVFVTKTGSTPTAPCNYMYSGNSGFYSYDWGSGREMGIAGHYSFDKRTPWHFTYKYGAPAPELSETAGLNSGVLFGNNEFVGGGTGAYIGGGNWEDTGSRSKEQDAVGYQDPDHPPASPAVPRLSRTAAMAGLDGATGSGCLVNSPCEIQYHGPALFSNFQDLQFAPTEQWRPGAGGGPPVPTVPPGVVEKYQDRGYPLGWAQPILGINKQSSSNFVFDNWANRACIGYGWHGVAPELASGDPGYVTRRISVSGNTQRKFTNMSTEDIDHQSTPVFRAEEITLHAPSELYHRRSRITGLFPELLPNSETGAINVGVVNAESDPIDRGYYRIEKEIAVDNPSEWPKGLFLSVIGAGGPAGACITSVSNDDLGCQTNTKAKMCVPHGTEDLDGNLLDYKAPFTEPTRQAEHGKEASAFLQLCPVGSYDDRGIDLLVVSTPGKGGVESWSEDGLFNTTFPTWEERESKVEVYIGDGFDDILEVNRVCTLRAEGGRAVRVDSESNNTDEECGSLTEAGLCVYDCPDDSPAAYKEVTDAVGNIAVPPIAELSTGDQFLKLGFSISMLSENIAFPSELADSMGITDSTSWHNKTGGIEEYAEEDHTINVYHYGNIHADLQSKGLLPNKTDWDMVINFDSAQDQYDFDNHHMWWRNHTGEGQLGHENALNAGIHPLQEGLFTPGFCGTATGISEGETAFTCWLDEGVWAPLTISENLQTVFGGVLGGESQVTKCDTRLGSMDDSCILNANSVAAYVKTQVAAYNFGAQTTSRELLENCLVFNPAAITTEWYADANRYDYRCPAEGDDPDTCGTLADGSTTGPNGEVLFPDGCTCPVSCFNCQTSGGLIYGLIDSETCKQLDGTYLSRGETPSLGTPVNAVPNNSWPFINERTTTASGSLDRSIRPENAAATFELGSPAMFNCFGGDDPDYGIEPNWWQSGTGILNNKAREWDKHVGGWDNQTGCSQFLSLPYNPRRDATANGVDPLYSQMMYAGSYMELAYKESLTKSAFYMRDQKSDGTLSPLYSTWRNWVDDKCADAIRLWGRRRIIFDQSDMTNRNHPLRVYESGADSFRQIGDSSCLYDELPDWINDDLPFGSGCGNIGEFSKPIPDGAEDCTDSGGVADYNCRVGYEVWESDNSWNAFNTYTGFRRDLIPLDLLTNDISYELDGVIVDSWQDYAAGFNAAATRRVIFDFRDKDTHFDDIDPRLKLLNWMYSEDTSILRDPTGTGVQAWTFNQMPDDENPNGAWIAGGAPFLPRWGFNMNNNLSMQQAKWGTFGLNDDLPAGGSKSLSLPTNSFGVNTTSSGFWRYGLNDLNEEFGAEPNGYPVDGFDYNACVPFQSLWYREDTRNSAGITWNMLTKEYTGSVPGQHTLFGQDGNIGGSQSHRRPPTGYVYEYGTCGGYANAVSCVLYDGNDDLVSFGSGVNQNTRMPGAARAGTNQLINWSKTAFVQRATTRPNDNFDPTFFDPDREVDSVGPEPGSRPSFWRLKTHTPSCLNEYDMLNRQIDTQVGDYSNNTDLNRWSGSGRKLGCDFDWNNNKYAQPLGRSIACATPPSISYTLYKPGLPGAAGNLKLWGLNPETASEGVGGNGGEAYVGFGPVFDTMFGNFPVDPEFPELGQLPRLETGESGFSEPTVVDEFVGDPTSHGYYCEPIVRWITHPFQAIGAEGLPIGIAAHHVEGIDKVVYQANGGPKLEITSRTRNSDGVEGYWARLRDSSSFVNDGQIKEIRAEIYPINGKPVVLQSKNPTHIVPTSDTQPVTDPMTSKCYQKDVDASNYAMWYCATTSRAVYVLDPTTDTFENALNRIQTFNDDPDGNPWIDGSTASPIIKIKNTSPLKAPWDDTIGVTFFADNTIILPEYWIPGMLTIEPEFATNRVGFTGDGPSVSSEQSVANAMIAGNIEFKNCDFHWSTRIETLEWPAETENFDSYFASLNDDDTKHVTYYLNGCTFDGGIEANKELLESAAWVADGMTGIAWFHDPRAGLYTNAGDITTNQTPFGGNIIGSHDAYASLATMKNTTISNSNVAISSGTNLVNTNIDGFIGNALTGINASLSVDIDNQNFGVAGGIYPAHIYAQTVDFAGGFNGDSNLTNVEYAAGTYVRFYDSGVGFAITQAKSTIPIGSRLLRPNGNLDIQLWETPSTILDDSILWETKENRTGKNVLVVDSIWNTGIVSQPLRSWDSYSYPENAETYDVQYNNTGNLDSFPSGYNKISNIGFIRTDIRQTSLGSLFNHLGDGVNQLDTHLIIDSCNFLGTNKTEFSLMGEDAVVGNDIGNDQILPIGNEFWNGDVPKNKRTRLLKYYRRAPFNTASTGGHAIRNSSFDDVRLNLLDIEFGGAAYNGAFGSDVANVDTSVNPSIRVQGSEVPFFTLWNMFGVTVENTTHNQQSYDVVSDDTANYEERYLNGPNDYSELRPGDNSSPFPFRLGTRSVTATYSSANVDTTEGGTKDGEVYLTVDEQTMNDLQLSGKQCGVSVFTGVGTNWPNEDDNASSTPNKIGGINFWFDSLEKATDFRNRANYLTRLEVTFENGNGTTGGYWTTEDPQILVNGDTQAVGFWYNSAGNQDTFTYNDLLEGGSISFEVNPIPDGPTTVNDNCDSGDAGVLRVGESQQFSTIQSAITAAVDGELILVDDGVYREAINFLRKKLIIRGNLLNPENCVIDGLNEDGTPVGAAWSRPASDPTKISVVTVDTRVAGQCYDNSNPAEDELDEFSGYEVGDRSLEGFTIRNGTSGARYPNTEPGCTPCEFNNGCECEQDCVGPNAPINCVDDSCPGAGIDGFVGGGLWVYRSYLSVGDCIFDNNVSDGGGGAFARESNVEFANCEFNNNVSRSNGGGLQLNHCISEVMNCNFNNNEADGTGVSGSGHGGAVHHFSGQLLIMNCNLLNNTCAGKGAGIDMNTRLVLSQARLHGNSSVIACTINSNTSTADDGCGGLYLKAGEVDDTGVADAKVIMSGTTICENVRGVALDISNFCEGSVLVDQFEDAGSNTICSTSDPELPEQCPPYL